MKRTRTKKEYPTENIIWGKTKTDDKFYTPTSESVRNMILSGETGAGEQIYDFNDGKDDGREIPIWRKEGVDRAEISQEILRTQNDIDDTIQDEKTKTNYERKKAQEKAENLNANKEALKMAINETRTEPKAKAKE